MDRIFDKVKYNIWAWSYYGLTIFGRITVAKSLHLSQYTYCATILDSSNKRFIEKVEYQINNFILYGRGGSTFKKMHRENTWKVMFSMVLKGKAAMKILT